MVPCNLSHVQIWIACSNCARQCEGHSRKRWTRQAINNRKMICPFLIWCASLAVLGRHTAHVLASLLGNRINSAENWIKSDRMYVHDTVPFNRNQLFLLLIMMMVVKLTTTTTTTMCQGFESNIELYLIHWVHLQWFLISIQFTAATNVRIRWSSSSSYKHYRSYYIRIVRYYQNFAFESNQSGFVVDNNKRQFR